MSNYHYTIQMILGTLALIALVGGTGLLVTISLPTGRAALVTRFRGLERHVIAWAWTIALIGTTGSLYLSDIVGFIPCLLCWYQRIAMYPLVFVLGVALVRKDTGVWPFAMPLPIVGFVIAAYHVALQLQPSLQVVECTTGVPCTARLLVVYGFVSIPVMAAAAFLAIAALLLTMRLMERPAGTA